MLAIIGNPVTHSKSPDIYNYLFKYFKINKEYTLRPVLDKEDLPLTIREFEAVNITYPFKEEAFKLCNTYEKSVRKIGSVNTIINKNGKLKGINTDGVGFARSISEFKNIDTILIIGAGATAKAASIALRDEGYLVVVASRSSIPLLTFGCFTYPFNQYNDRLEPDLVVNMTPVGLEDDNLPFPAKIESIIETASVCIDLIYGHETPFLKLAKEKGKITRDGRDLLKYQAIYAFQYFTKFKIPLKDIEKALEKLSI